MNIVLVSFGDKKWEKALVRLANQAKSCNLFYQIVMFDEKLLREKTLFYQDNPDVLNIVPEGHGGWLWKTYIIQYVFKNFKDADYFLYCDSGNELNITPTTYNRFLDYVEMANKNNIFACYSVAPEKRFTHCSIINKISPNNYAENQFNASTIFIKNNNDSLGIINEWQNFAKENNYDNLKKEKSFCCEEFWGNLHDQAILSCVLKSHGVIGIADEFDWIQSNSLEQSIEDNLKKYPIFNVRNITGNTIVDKCLKYWHSTKCIHSEDGSECPNMFIVREAN